MEKSSQVLVIPALLTLDVIVVAVAAGTSLSRFFTSDLYWGILGVALLIADLVIGLAIVRYWDRPSLSYVTVVPSRTQLNFMINGKPVSKDLNVLSVQMANHGRRAAYYPAVVMDAANMARGGAHVFFDFGREFHHPSFLPLQAITTSPTERELAYLVYQASKEVPLIEGGETGEFMVGFSFGQSADAEGTRVYLPSAAAGEPYPILPYESWYVELFAQHRGSKMRPISKGHFVFRGSKWGEPQLTPTEVGFEQAVKDYQSTRFSETSSETDSPDVPA